MQGNPFYVDPFGGYGKEIVQGLSGLGAVIGQRQEEKRKKAEENALKQEAQDVFASNDPMRISQFYIKAPEFAQRVQGAVTYKNKATEQNMIESMQRILAGEDPRQVITERAQFVQSQGGDPIDTLQELDVYQQNPEGYKAIVENALIRRYPDVAIKMREASKPLEGQKLTGNMANAALAMFGTADISQLTPEQREQVRLEATKSGSQGTPANIQEFELAKSQGFEGSILDFMNQRAGRGVGIELSPFAEKRLSAANDEAVQATDNVGKFNALADEIDAAGFSGGVLGGSWREKIKDLTGQQDAVTDLRKKFNAIRSSQVVQNLPPGAASDADIALALSGFPNDNARAEQLSGFLRGMAKMEGLRSEFSEFKASYISENKTESGLLKAWKAQNGQSGEEKPQKPKAIGNFSESAIAAAAKARGVTPEQFRKDAGL
jgi:hypothetical protein